MSSAKWRPFSLGLNVLTKEIIGDAMTAAGEMVKTVVKGGYDQMISVRTWQKLGLTHWPLNY